MCICGCREWMPRDKILEQKLHRVESLVKERLHSEEKEQKTHTQHTYMKLGITR